MRSQSPTCWPVIEVSASPRTLTALGYSCVVHLAAILVLALCVRPDDRPVVESVLFETSIESSWELPVVESLPAMAPTLAEANVSLGPANAHPGNSATVGGSPRNSAPSAPRFVEVGRGSLLDIICAYEMWTGLNEEVGEPDPIAGAEGLGGTGGGTGYGNGSGGIVGGSFFGVAPKGQTVVYVVDASRSMNHPYAGDAKTRFRRLKIELVQSIGAMSPDMSFFVIFFNIDAIPMPASHPQAATPENKQRYGQWIAQAKADRETDPRRALQMAIRMRPDVIYFLTDGDFDRPIERELQKMAQRQTVIHTFAFGKEAGRDALRSLAKANGGKFFVIP